MNPFVSFLNSNTHTDHCLLASSKTPTTAPNQSTRRGGGSGGGGNSSGSSNASSSKKNAWQQRRQEENTPRGGGAGGGGGGRQTNPPPPPFQLPLSLITPPPTNNSDSLPLTSPLPPLPPLSSSSSTFFSGESLRINFLLILKTVVETDGHLLDSDGVEMRAVRAFQSLSAEAQQCFVRLYLRKGPWFRLDQLVEKHHQRQQRQEQRQNQQQSAEKEDGVEEEEEGGEDEGMDGVTAATTDNKKSAHDYADESMLLSSWIRSMAGAGLVEVTPSLSPPSPPPLHPPPPPSFLLLPPPLPCLPSAEAAKGEEGADARAGAGVTMPGLSPPLLPPLIFNLDWTNTKTPSHTNGTLLGDTSVTATTTTASTIATNDTLLLSNYQDCLIADLDEKEYCGQPNDDDGHEKEGEEEGARGRGGGGGLRSILTSPSVLCVPDLKQLAADLVRA